MFAVKLLFRHLNASILGVSAFMCVYVHTEVCEAGKARMLTYLEVALGPWAAVPCLKVPVGALRSLFQAGRA